MGQFQSREYDGDPYIDLMRAIPERELIWWVQKVIWVSSCCLPLACHTSQHSCIAAAARMNGAPFSASMLLASDGDAVLMVQLAEGWTFMEHFMRTYPSMCLYKCQECNGTGAITCPHCQGYKIKQKRGQPLVFKLKDMTGPKVVVHSSDRQECQHCGDYCEWDEESEWQEK